MKPIAVFYHTAFNICDGKFEHAHNIIREQMDLLKVSGLADEAALIFVGVNGTKADAERLKLMLPRKAMIVINDEALWPSGEVPTLRHLGEMLPMLEGYNVCYFHMKGLRHLPGSHTHDQNRDWRHAMQHVVIRRWRECVGYLRDHDSVGQWWNVAFNGSYWAGNFWWATAEFLATLPYLKIEDQNEGGRYEAEVWIGRGPNLPRFVSL